MLDRFAEGGHELHQDIPQELGEAWNVQTVMKRLIGHRLIRQISEKPHNIHQALRGTCCHGGHERPDGPDVCELS